MHLFFYPCEQFRRKMSQPEPHLNHQWNRHQLQIRTIVRMSQHLPHLNHQWNASDKFVRKSQPLSHLNHQRNSTSTTGRSKFCLVFCRRHNTSHISIINETQSTATSGGSKFCVSTPATSQPAMKRNSNSYRRYDFASSQPEPHLNHQWNTFECTTDRTFEMFVSTSATSQLSTKLGDDLRESNSRANHYPWETWRELVSTSATSQLSTKPLEKMAKEQEAW